MKTIVHVLELPIYRVFLMALMICAFNCSSDDDIKTKTINYSYTVLNIESNEPVKDVIVGLDGEIICGGVLGGGAGCGRPQYGRGITDSMGKVTISITEEDKDKIVSIALLGDGYPYQELDFNEDITILFIEPF